MKTHFKKMVNPDYLGSWDLMDAEGNFIKKTVTIKAVVVKKVHDGNGGETDCMVIELNECKPIIANSTNRKAIAKSVKSVFVEDWVGQKLVLYVEKVSAFGAIHDAIRVVKTPYKLPKLIADSEDYNKCLKAILNGFTIEQVKTKFTLDANMEKLLTDKIQENGTKEA
jgi:predicted RNA binding protein with dsRBD fold (UPF0201 family)